MTNYADLNGRQLSALIFKLMEARGRNGKCLKLRKIEQAWRDKQTTFDKMIPEELDEEWRGENSFVNIEIPMQGSVTKAADLTNFVEHIWSRLGLLAPHDPDRDQLLKRAAGHVHWLPDVQALPLGKRQSVNEAIVGYWGDLNDSSLVRGMNAFSDRIGNDGRVKLTHEDANSIYHAWFENGSIGPLLREIYGRVKADAKGIRIAERERDLEPAVDPNIPPVFKRLFVGMRGAYGQSTLPPGVPIPKTGLEVRNEPTLIDSVQALPKKVPGEPLVDLPKLLSHRSKEARGILGDAHALASRAADLGIPRSLIDDFDLATQVFPYKWTLAQKRAFSFLPLNEWLEHPLVERNLNLMTHQARAKSVARYQSALQLYSKRMIDLAKARRDPSYRYRPDWSGQWDPPMFPNGFNRVAAHNPSPSVGVWLYDPDATFRHVVEIEAMRFVAESDLSNLLKMPQ